jgi:hypothetical protein
MKTTTEEIQALDLAKLEAFDHARALAGLLRDPEVRAEVILAAVEEALVALGALRDAARPVDQRDRARHQARLVSLYVTTGDADALEFLLLPSTGGPETVMATA